MARSAEDWLAPAATVQSAVKLAGERKRAKTMHKSMLGKGRTWATDGEFVYFRRRQANPASLDRHNRFLQTGDYQHVATEDDVEIYKLMPSSPFKRAQQDLVSMQVAELRRTAAIAACKHDYGLFTDALSELASKVKGAVYSDGKPASGPFAEQLWQDQLSYVFKLIELRRGPSVDEVNRGVVETRQRRGDTRNRILLLPPGAAA